MQFRQQHWIYQIFSTTYCRLFSCCVSAVPLGSIEELPGKSCAEIKASEGKAMTYGLHWVYSDENLDHAIQATCDGNSLSLYQVYIEISQLIKYPYIQTNMTLGYSLSLRYSSRCFRKALYNYLKNEVINKTVCD